MNPDSSCMSLIDKNKNEGHFCEYYSVINNIKFQLVFFFFPRASSFIFYFVIHFSFCYVVNFHSL